MTSRPSAGLEPSWAVRLGSALRHARESRNLTLRQVETLTEGRIRATAVSSYERGIRVISPVRLLELAQLYGLTADELTNRARGTAPTQRLVIDLAALESAAEPLLRSFVDRLSEQRMEEPGPWLAIRREDLRDVAQYEPPSVVEERLWRKGVLVPMSVMTGGEQKE